MVGISACLGGILCLAFPLHPKYFLVSIGLGAIFLAGFAPITTGTARRTAAVVIFIFLCVTALSVSLSASPLRSAKVAVTILPGILLAYLIATQFASRHIHALVYVLTALPAIAGSYLLWVALSHRASSPEHWLSLAGYHHLSVPNDLLFLVLLAPFPCALLFSNRQTDRVFALFSILLVGACIILYKSRSGMVLLFCALAAASLRHRHSLSSIGSVLALFVVIDAWIGFAMIHKFMAITTLTTRIPLWMAAWEMFLDAPWLGLGPGAFAVSSDGYLANVTVPSWVLFDQRHIPWAHNLYLELLAERGLLGFILFITLFAVVIRQVNHTIRGRVVPADALLASRDALYLILLAGFIELSLLRLWFVVCLSIVMGIALSSHIQGDRHAFQ